ncbi:MAG: methyltransferase domain-containing protein [Candidatus Woesearchaeota archaeon]
MIKKVIYSKKDLSKVYVKDPSKDVHMKFGMIKSSDLDKREAKSNINQEFFILDADLKDCFEKLNRDKQTVIPKDASIVLAHTLLNSNSVIADIGTGAGGFACFMSFYVNKVFSFDIDERAVELGRKNAEFLGAKNIEFSKLDIYNEKLPAENLDLVFLDLPDPSKAVPNIKSSLKRGGYLVCYNPQITQHQELINNINKEEFIHLSTIELIERDWEVGGRKARPDNKSIGHTAFLSFFRSVI